MQFGSMQTLLGHILPASHEHTGTPRRINGRENESPGITQGQPLQWTFLSHDYASLFIACVYVQANDCIKALKIAPIVCGITIIVFLFVVVVCFLRQTFISKL